jgi:diguanylate cyclase (GGDEF)-like protein/PAS domain S-box-containing protein
MSVLFIHHNITNRKQAEILLRQAEAKYRDIFENAIEGIFQSTPDGRFINVNTALARIFGYESPEAMISSIGNNISTRIYAHPDDRDDFVCKLRETGVVKEFEAENLRKDGSLIWTRTSARTIKGMDGKVLYYEGFLEDITESKMAKEGLQKANDMLQNRLDKIQLLQETLLEQANRDALTGLYNRHYLYATVERELARAKRENYHISVLMIDIDHFKGFNDTHGHQAGDVVLKALGGLLRDSIRQGDIACRYGGEEFIVLIPGMSKVAAERRAEAFRSDFNQLLIPYGGGKLSATISIGVATYPDHGSNMEEIIKAADLALYEAKQAGRNRVCVWENR